MEEPFFFKSGKFDLFGVLHKPEVAAKGAGIIFCHPFADEKLYSHRVVVNFARRLSDEGYHSLRFDFRGNGDSTGNFEDCSLSGQIEDIGNAIQVLKSRTNPNKIGLLGLRFGSIVITIAAKKIKQIDFLIYWAPIVNLKNYLQQLLRANLSFQMSLYRRIVLTRKQLVENLNSGEAVNLGGYYMGSEFYKESNEIKLGKETNNLGKKRLIVQTMKCAQTHKNEVNVFDSSTKSGTECQTVDANELSFWEELKVHYPTAINSYGKIIKWLNNEVSDHQNNYLYNATELQHDRRTIYFQK